MTPCANLNLVPSPCMVLGNGLEATGSPYVIPGNPLAGDLGEHLTADNPNTELAYA